MERFASVTFILPTSAPHNSPFLRGRAARVFHEAATPSPRVGVSIPCCKPISFPSLSNKLLPSEAGGGSGTGRGGGRWFQRRRQDDPQEQASLLCWMNIHKCVSYFCKHVFMSPLWIKPGVFALKSFHCVLVCDFASLGFQKPATKKLVSIFSVRVPS